MKKLIFSFFILAAFSLISCNAGGGDPKTVLMSFFDALGKKDITKAKKLATKDSESMLEMVEMGMKMAPDSVKNTQYDKTKMEFGDAKIEGDKATVPVKDKSSGEITNFTLKKEKDGWKVAFDKATMMQIGQDKMKEKGMDSTNIMNNDSLLLKDTVK